VRRTKLYAFCFAVSKFVRLRGRWSAGVSMVGWSIGSDCSRWGGALALVKKVVFVAEVLLFFGQKFSFLEESLPKKSFDSNPAVGPVVSVSTGLGFFHCCPFFLFCVVCSPFSQKNFASGWSRSEDFQLG
jgi:hypothetical protein